jgi:hypothetical protein
MSNGKQFAVSVDSRRRTEKQTIVATVIFSELLGWKTCCHQGGANCRVVLNKNGTVDGWKICFRSFEAFCNKKD